MSRILSLTFAAGLVALLAACSTPERTEVGSGTSTPGAKVVQRLGAGMWPMPKAGPIKFGRPAPEQPQSTASR
jgi:hypothetical protein